VPTIPNNGVGAVLVLRLARQKLKGFSLGLVCKQKLKKVVRQKLPFGRENSPFERKNSPFHLFQMVQTSETGQCNFLKIVLQSIFKDFSPFSFLEWES